MFIDDLKGTQCFGISWYLSNDFQMFLTAPILVFIFIKSEIGGYILSFLLFVGASFVTSYSWGANGYTWDFPTWTG